MLTKVEILKCVTCFMAEKTVWILTGQKGLFLSFAIQVRVLHTPAQTVQRVNSKTDTFTFDTFLLL